MSARSGFESRHPAAFLQRHGTQQFHDLPKMWRRQHAVPLQPVLGEPARGNVGEIFDGAGAADGKVDVVRSHFAQGVHGMALHVVQDAVVLARRYHPMRAGGELPAQANGPEPQRVEIAVLVLGAQDDFGAAAADVDEEGLFVFQVKAARNAQVDQPRFLLARHHAHVELRGVLQPLYKLPLILRLTRCRSGHGNDVVGTVRANHRSKLLADGHGAVDSLGLQNLVVELALTETHRLFELNEHVGGLVRIDADDQQANGIGADVHEGDVARFRARKAVVHAASRKVNGRRTESTNGIKAATTVGVPGSLPRRVVGR